jgi:hypothetical protein
MNWEDYVSLIIAYGSASISLQKRKRPIRAPPFSSPKVRRISFGLSSMLKIRHPAPDVLRQTLKFLMFRPGGPDLCGGRFRSARNQRQPDDEPRPVADLAVDLNLALMGFDDPVGMTEPQTSAFDFPRAPPL